MLEPSIFDWNDYLRICHILKDITKIDVRLIDSDGKAILQLVDHYPPSVLQIFAIEYQTINDTLKSNESNSCYHYVNSNGLEYIASGIWNHRSFYGFIVIGPFIS